MPLAPPPTGGEGHVSEDLLIEALNKHAGPEGYAVSTARSKKSKKGQGIKNKVYIRCDRGGKPDPNGKGSGKRLHCSSRRNDCPFSAVAKLNTADDCWYLTDVRNPDHNHVATLAGAHPALRKLAMTVDVRKEIAQQVRVGVSSNQILTTLRLDTDQENPLFKRSDIYNVKSHIRSLALGTYTPVQALLEHLQRDDWFFKHEEDESHRVTKLFFSRASSQTILKINSEVLLMDCTYKVNRYKMPLLVINGVTALNTTFYVGFAFLASERTADYVWVLTQLKLLYDELDISPPEVILTDCERGLINASRLVFSTTQHLLCIWHIDKNVLINCRKDFGDDEEWQTFYTDWHKVMYAHTTEQFEAQWTVLSNKYDQRHPTSMLYLQCDLLRSYKKKFVKCWTDQCLHFNNHATSRSEGSHAKLKRGLMSSTGDLKTVVDSLELLLVNQYQDYVLAIESAKARLPHSLQLPLLRELVGHVTPFALLRILDQFHMLTRGGPLTRCTKTYTTTMGLPCVHKIQERVFDFTRGGVLALEDVHSHWRFEKSPVTRPGVEIDATSTLMDPLLLIQDPAVVRPKGRPSGARGRANRRQEEEEAEEEEDQSMNTSTQRDPSRFEHVLAEVESGQAEAEPTTSRRESRGGVRGPRGPRGPRGGRRGRGAARGAARGRGGPKGGRGEGRQNDVIPPPVHTEAGLFAAFHM